MCRLCVGHRPSRMQSLPFLLLVALSLPWSKCDNIIFEDNPILKMKFPNVSRTTEDSTESFTERLGLIGPAVGLPAVPGLSTTEQHGHHGHHSEDLVSSTGSHQLVLPPRPPPPPPPPPTQDTFHATRYPPKLDVHEECSCTYDCQPKNTDGTGLINIRIVVEHPPGVVCRPKEVYCCYESVQTTLRPVDPPVREKECGTYNIIPVPSVPVNYGQAEFGEFPWMAILLHPNNSYVGLGALIDPYHVLTVAHRVYEKAPTHVRLGDWKVKDSSEPYLNVELEVDWVRTHPEFNSGNLHNDVAVVRLRHPVQVDRYPHINTACLPQDGEIPSSGSRCLVSGWGKDGFGPKGQFQQILKRVDVPIVEGDECERRLRGTRLGDYFRLDRHSFLCAGGEPGKDACTGDGGAPLVCGGPNGRKTVVGLVAWGISCATDGHPGVYVHVPNFIPWIQQQLYS